MIVLKIITSLLLLADLILGCRFFLNVINVLQTTKYGKTATALYAFIFLGLAVAGIYFLFFKQQIKPAAWLSIAPWALILTIMLITMLTSDYK